jgi:hypothetical protein
MQALLHGGKLDLSKQAGGLVCSDMGDGIHLIWPAGFTTDAVTVYDAERHLVALTGDMISLSGGYEPSSTPPDPCGPSEQAWLVEGVAQARTLRLGAVRAVIPGRRLARLKRDVACSYCPDADSRRWRLR